MLANDLDKILHIPNLSIKGFRGIADLSIPRLGRVTLITGMNNTGKTSILEAVRLLTEGASPDVIREILQLREENTEGLSTDVEIQSGENFLLSPLFHGFPQPHENLDPIVISSDNGKHQIRMEVGWFIETEEEDGSIRLVPSDTDLLGEQVSIPALIVFADKRRRVYPINRINRLASNRRTNPRYDQTIMSSRFVSSSGQERTEMLGALWDSISLGPMEQRVIESLQIIEPNVSAVSMIGGNSGRQSRTAVVWYDSFSRRVPLRSFGDGMNRIFGIILALVNTKGGILIIDEFENGMHYTVQAQAWKMVFTLAEELNVQVLATTHSFDCVAGFRQAAAELEQVDGLLVRIDRIGDLMRVVEYTEEDLQVAVSQRIEVR